jgi:hypothetical protein
VAELPKPVRAYIGLWAQAITEARDLPRRAAEFPVLAASTTARATLRLGQRYADLVNLGDDVLSRMQGAPEEPPEWATFDDDDLDPELEDRAADDLADEAALDAEDDAEAASGSKSVRAPRGRAPSAFDRVSDGE